MTPKQLKKMMKDADFTQVESFMRQFDRILLYNMAFQSMPPEFLQTIVRIWSKAIKAGIDKEADHRNCVLQSTVLGRRAKYAEVPDGEALRLDALKQFEIAKNIISSNLIPDNEEDDEEDDDVFDFEDEIDEIDAMDDPLEFDPDNENED